MSFTQKLIDVSFNLAQGNFGGGGNSASITGLRVSAVIEVLGMDSSGSLTLAIYGLPLAMMNQLTILPGITQQSNNEVSVFAGDEQGGLNLVYKGLVFSAFVDAANMPQFAFRVSGSPSGGYYATKPAPPISKSGPQDVSQMMQQLAGQMGLQFENNGVNTKLTNPYYPSSPWNQAVAIARDANIHLFVERGVLAIKPIGTPRSGNVYISKETGMVGYPAFRDAAVILKALFNPAVKVGSTMQIQSDLTPACGNWEIKRIVYELESKMPHGRWFIELTNRVNPKTLWVVQPTCGALRKREAMSKP